MVDESFGQEILFTLKYAATKRMISSSGALALFHLVGCQAAPI